MTFLEQLRMKKTLEEKGRQEVAAKNEAEALISKVRESINSAESIGVEVTESQALLKQSEKAMLEKDYHKALEISKRASIQIEREAQDQILDRYLHLRRIFSISMVPESSELNYLLEQGEFAISTSIPDSIDISRRAYDSIYDYLLRSRFYLRDIVSELFVDYLQEERLSDSLNNLISVEGDAETIHAAMEKVISVVRKICEEKTEWLKIYSEKLSRFVGEIEYMDIVWKELRSHFKQNDFKTVKKELDLIEHGLNSQLEMGLPQAFRQAERRLEVLKEFGVDYPEGPKLLEMAERKLLKDPLNTLEDYVKIMEQIQEKESDFITNMIQEIRDMITVGRHINIDLTDVIIGLDEVRLHLRKGDLKRAVKGVEQVKITLLDRMGGYNELELAFFSLAELVKEVDEYGLRLDEPMKIVNQARNTMTGGGFEKSLSMVKDAIQLIHQQTRELLGEKMIMAQKSLQSAFRIEADTLENSHRLGQIYQTIIDGEYKGMSDQITHCRLEIESELHVHAKRYLQSFLKEVEERENVYDVKKIRLQAKGAEKLLNEGSAEESYRIIWTARRQLSNLDFDALESKLKKVRELVATGEAIEVDVSDLKRMMFSFSYDGKNVNMKMISDAGELTENVLARLYNNLLQKLHRAHILAYQAKMAGYQTDEQLASLKKAFRLLEKREFRSAYGALKEAEIGYNIQILVHDEVYDRLLRISSIISQESLNDKEIKKSFDLFQNGKYREADMESKKLLRSLIERGLKAAAAGILEDSRDLIDTGDMLQLKIVSLRESLPQAAFFLENGDYRNASSLMEKAIRTGRSEISKALQERVTNLRPRISEPMMNKREKIISRDMLENARSNMEAGRYQLAVSIILHLEMDLEKRSMLVNRCRMAQLRAREFIGLGKMLDVETKAQENLANQGDALLRDGFTLLSYETLERSVDQVGDLISLRARLLQHNALESAVREGTNGPDLEKLLADIEPMIASVHSRHFHAAKDINSFIETCMTEVLENKEDLESALKSLQEFITEMSLLGMDAEVLKLQLKDIEACHQKGEFGKGLEISAITWLNLHTAFNAFQDAQHNAKTLEKQIHELPTDWVCQKTIDAIENSLRMISSLKIEEGYKSLMEAERTFQLDLQNKRIKTKEEILFAWNTLGKPCPYEIIGIEDELLNERRIEVLILLNNLINQRMNKLELALANSSWPNEQSRELLTQAKNALSDENYNLVIEKLQLATITLGRDEFGAKKSISDYQNLMDKILELNNQGIDTDKWEASLMDLPADRIKVDRTHHLFSVQTEIERKNSLPKISIEHLEERIVIRNLGPGIARNITIGNNKIEFLGINQSKSVPRDLMNGATDLSYYPLTSETPRIMKIKV